MTRSFANASLALALACLTFLASHGARAQTGAAPPPLTSLAAAMDQLAALPRCIQAGEIDQPCLAHVLSGLSPGQREALALVSGFTGFYAERPYENRDGDDPGF